MLRPAPRRPLGPPLGLAALLLVLAGLSGCSGDDDCTGQTFEVDPAAEGSPSPIRAVEAWLGDPGDFDEQPPTDGWFVLQTEETEPAKVVITNDAGNGWWVQAVRTDGGGYVVAQATDDWAACEDDLG